MASLFRVDPEKFNDLFSQGFELTDCRFRCADFRSADPDVMHWADLIKSGVTLRPMIGTRGKLWTCGRPGQMRCVALTPESAYRSWSRMQ